MTTKKIFIAGYDDGNGFKVIDPSTGELIRQVLGSWWTDDLEGSYIDGDQLYVFDSDGTLVRADLDGVVRAQCDIGYYGKADSSSNAFWGMYASSDFIYHLHQNNTSNPHPLDGNQGDSQPSDQDLYYIVQRDKLTLEITNKVKLRNDLLDDGNYKYYDTNVLCWETDGFWLYLNGGPNYNHAVKVGYDGVPTGAQIDFGGVSFSSWNYRAAVWTSDTSVALLGFNFGGSLGVDGLVLDFTALTATHLSYSVNANVGWPNLDATKTFLQYEDGVISFPFFDSSVAWSDGVHDAWNGGWRKLSFNLADGTGDVVSSPVWLNVHDKVLGNQAQYCEAWAPYDSDRFFMIDENKGVWLANFTTGQAEYTTGYSFMKGYSSDAAEIDRGCRMVEVPVYTLSGRVTAPNGSGVATELFVHDQATGILIAKTQSDSSGNFSINVFTKAKKYVVCPTNDPTKNFKISAHRVAA